MCTSHLVGGQSENAVQVLDQLFECGPVGGDGMPAVLHHHVPEEEEKIIVIYVFLCFVCGATNTPGSMKGQLLHFGSKSMWKCVRSLTLGLAHCNRAERVWPMTTTVKLVLRRVKPIHTSWETSFKSTWTPFYHFTFTCFWVKLRKTLAWRISSVQN